eukprot:COSAG03_NODE_12514_length_543_cov_2.828829_1_plen_60_part_10
MRHGPLVDRLVMCNAQTGHTAMNSSTETAHTGIVLYCMGVFHTERSRVFGFRALTGSRSL